MSRPRRTTSSTIQSGYADDMPRPRRRGTDSSRRSSSSRYSEAYSDPSSHRSRAGEGEDDEHGHVELDHDLAWDKSHTASRHRKKQDEPMSPILVVFYVTALYLVFQLLTRSDDLEILSHLPSTSSLRSATAHLGLGGSNLHSDLQQHHYGNSLPYHMPQIPSPMPNTPADRPTSLWRIVGGVIFYPFYLLITLLAIPVPILLNLLHIVLAVVLTVLYPLTSTATLVFKTFVLAPLGVVRSVVDTFWPIIAFVGGVIVVGCFMGLIGGWMGRLGLDWVDRRMRGRKGTKGLKRTRSARSGRERGDSSGKEHGERRLDRMERTAPKDPASRTHEPRRADRTEKKSRSERHWQTEDMSTRDRSSRPHRNATLDESQSDSGSIHEVVTPPRRQGIHTAQSRRGGDTKGKRRAVEEDIDENEDEYGHDHDHDHAGFEEAWRGDGRASAREPQVTGTRKRTHMFEGR